MFLPSPLWGASNSILFMTIPLIPRFVCAFLMERLSTPRNQVNLQCILVFHGVSDGERTPLLFVSLFLALKSFLLPGPWHLPPYCVFQLSLTGPISSISCILITSGRSDLQAAHERENTQSRPAFPDVQQQPPSEYWESLFALSEGALSDFAVGVLQPSST